MRDKKRNCVFRNNFEGCLQPAEQSGGGVVEMTKPALQGSECMEMNLVCDENRWWRGRCRNLAARLIFQSSFVSICTNSLKNRLLYFKNWLLCFKICLLCFKNWLLCSKICLLYFQNGLLYLKPSALLLEATGMAIGFSYLSIPPRSLFKAKSPYFIDF